MKFDNLVLGAGVSAISLPIFSDKKYSFIEKEKKIGGLCRSFKFDEVNFDIGPHIVFSKHPEVLRFMRTITPMKRLKRSNQILFKKKFVKYPFENNLFRLSKLDKDYCLNTFLDNPYKNYEPKNMLSFFLKNFGEGITRLYLEPYNKKIWKFDPSMMDLQMVNRIPKPPDTDIINSYKGIKSEGYKHQLYFYYPKKGGIESMVNSLVKKGSDNIENIFLNQKIMKISKNRNVFNVETDKEKFQSNNLISTIPMNKLIECLNFKVPKHVKEASNNLLSNSIYITMIKLKRDNLKKNFTITIPDPNIIFHRLNKLNFINDEIKNSKYTYLMVEITFRENIKYDNIMKLNKRVIDDLETLDLIEKKNVIRVKTLQFKDAYVIYDLHHRKNVDTIEKYLKSINIHTLGRFGKFKYINSDQAIYETMNFCKQEFNNV